MGGVPLRWDRPHSERTGAFYEGFNAYRRGCPLKFNRYPYRTYRQQWLDWRDGWWLAAKEDE